jgi:peptide/nickel transport system substrate-binding protein
MRRLLVGGVALALVVVACTGSVEDATAPPGTLTTTSSTVAATITVPTATTSTTRAPSGPGYGGTVIIADDQFPQTLNPFAPGGDNFIVAIIGQAWLTGVWDIDGYTLERIPEVVTELPTVANGGIVVNKNRTMTVTYHIRDEAVWSDGVPISGGDFEFTMDTALVVEKSAEFESDYTDAAIISTEVGDKTFTMTLRRPTMQYETLFRWLIPRHAVEGSDFVEDWNTTTWPSGGPFILESFEENKTVTLARNDRYWKTDPATGMQLPYLDRVEFQFIPEIERIVSAFRTREVDVIQPPALVQGTIEPLQKLESDGAIIDVIPGPVWEHVNFQFSDERLDRSPNSCNDDLVFRRAVMHAIDRDAAAESAFPGYGIAMQSYVEAFKPSISTDAWDRYPYDPEAAAALYQTAVEEAGHECTAVFNTTGNSDMRPRLALLYEEMMERAGIPFDVQLKDSSVFFGEMLDDATWDIGQWAWVGSPGLVGLIGIHDVFDPKGPPPKGDNFYRWGTPGSSVRDEHTKRFAEIVKEMNTTVDEAEIIALVREAEEILADQAVILPIVQLLVLGAVWGDEIGGFKMNASQASHTWNIEEWYRTDR